MGVLRKIFLIFVISGIVHLWLVGGVSAANYDCDSELNDAVIPELALCSTHAYNIGVEQNPENETKQQMQEIVRMKTTVITQQMYKQYQEMESMVRRLRTQLEKAIYSKDFMSGEDKKDTGGDSDTGTPGSGDKYIVLDNAKNCVRESGDYASVIECLQYNLKLIEMAVDSGKTTDARKQLIKDIETAQQMGLLVINKSNDASNPTCEVKGKGYPNNSSDGAPLDRCTELYCKKEKAKAKITGCAEQVKMQILLYNQEMTRQQNSRPYGWPGASN